MHTHTGKPLVCVVDDDVSIRESVQGLLRQEGYQVELFESAEAFLGRARQEPPACLILDFVLPGLSGLDLHRELVRTGLDGPTLLLTGHGDIPTSVRAMKEGALDFLTKPCDPADLLAAVRQALSTRGPERHPGVRRMEGLVGRSEALQGVLRQADRVADTDATVLITGESGTGKELVARAIHQHSRRSARHFVGINCAAIPAALVASELFGHERGAFTGALQRRLGRFELAEGGTLFLDEVGDLPPETQIALLRVLQEREFERVGGGRPIATDVRVIAATHRDLEAAVAVGSFRSDLFYRLNVVPITLPPLRDRREDIPLLVEHFAERFARQAGVRPRPLSRASLELLMSHTWPGNVRELQNVIERAVILADGESLVVDGRWLHRTPVAPLPAPPPTVTAPAATALPFVAQRRRSEKVLIEEALGETGGRVAGPSGAAARLRMPASTLESRIRSLGIDKQSFRRVYAFGASSDSRTRV